MLSRKEVSTAYGKIETKFKRLKRDLAAAGIDADALATITETLDAQQLKQSASIYEAKPESKETIPATY